MYEVRRSEKRVHGETVTTWKQEIALANIVEVEAGTNGYHGGDSGHGSRTYIRIEDLGGTDLTVQQTKENGVVLALGGDSELTTIIEALKFILKVLEDQAHETSVC